jgi:LytS/YehU family sensor histidine kinase
MRFKDKFDYIIKLDENVHPSTPVPKMIIQSYAENAIKHGLMHRKAGGQLTIQIQEVNSQLLVMIEDNGVGREMASHLNPDTTHRGFRIMEQIIELYRKLYHTEITQTIEDLVDKEGNSLGTRVILSIFLLNDSAKKGETFSFRNIFKRYGN